MNILHTIKMLHRFPSIFEIVLVEKSSVIKNLSPFQLWHKHQKMKQVCFITKNLTIKNLYNKNHYTFFLQSYGQELVCPNSTSYLLPFQGRCKQFFCIRCIYVLPLPHHPKQNMLMQLLFLFCFILCRVFLKQVK